MTDNRKDTVHAITISQAIEKWGSYLAERHGGGNVDAGWARLQRTMDQERPTLRRRPVQRAKKASGPLTQASRMQSAAEVFVGCALLAGTVVTFIRTVGGWWVIPAALLLFYISDRSTKNLEVRLQEQERKKELQESREKINQAVARREAASAFRDLLQRNPHHFSQCQPGRKDKPSMAGGAATPSSQPACPDADPVGPASPALTGVDLTRADLLSLNLIGADLSGANLDGNTLRAANLYGANLCGTTMFSTDLSRADLTGAKLTSATLCCANLTGARLVRANLSGAGLAGANVSSAMLSEADLSSTDLSGAMLSGADLSSADLSGANLSGAYMSDVHLHSANLTGAVLCRANLRGAYLYRANLTCADLTGAKLTHAVFTHAILIDADLTGAEFSALAELQDVTWSERTSWGHYRVEVQRRSIPIGRGRYKLNPTDNSPTNDQPIVPWIPV
ncbi:pentapeptide repeat-containing protein [Nocardia gipuzkoensis]